MSSEGFETKLVTRRSRRGKLESVLLDDRSRAYYVEAVSRARRLIDHDIEAATDEGVKAILGFFRFKPFTVNVGSLKANLRPSKGSIKNFKVSLNVGLKEYISLRIKKPAAEWLLATNLEIWRIAAMLGYATLCSFDVAFESWTGHLPSDFRNRQKAADPRLDAIDIAESLRLWLQGSDRTAMGHRRLWQWVEPRLGSDSGGWLEFVVAEMVNVLDELPWDQQVSEVEGIAFVKQPRLFFDALCGHIIPASRQRRERGVEIAQLALAHLKANEASFGPDAADLRTIGEAQLGNAWRLAHDWDEAEAAFARAERAWATPRSKNEPQAELDLRLNLGTLRWQQGRMEEAADCLSRAVALGHSFGPPRLLARALLTRGPISAARGHVPDAVADYRNALEVLGGLDAPDLVLIAHQDLALDLLELDRISEAEVEVAEARELCRVLAEGDRPEKSKVRFTEPKLDWIEGRIHKRRGNSAEAEMLFRQARLGLLAVDLRHEAAILSLDWALLALEAGKDQEAESLATAAFPVFEVLQTHPKVAAVARLLRKGVGEKFLSRVILMKARNTLVEFLRPQAVLERRSAN